MNPADFIATARDLVQANTRGRPRETNLRRAVSTTYYALFHGLAECCADMLVGGPGANRSQPAWRQAYRALQHGDVRKRCERQTIIKEFPTEIRTFANLFVLMQKERHRADYDPEGVFAKDEVLQNVAEAERRLSIFTKAPAKDRRAFAVYVLFPMRND